LERALNGAICTTSPPLIYHHKQPQPKPKTQPKKVDRHKYVKLAYHGFKPLPRAARDAAYGRGRDDLDAPNYAMVDTLFSLAETHLFAQLVELAVCGSSVVLGSEGCSSE
jgi:hypothetical protein